MASSYLPAAALHIRPTACRRLPRKANAAKRTRDDPRMVKLAIAPQDWAPAAITHRELFQSFLSRNSEHEQIELGHHEDSNACRDLWLMSFSAPPTNPMFLWLVQDSSLKADEELKRMKQLTRWLIDFLTRPAFSEGLLIVIRDSLVEGGISGAAILDIAGTGSSSGTLKNYWDCGLPPSLRNLLLWGFKPAMKGLTVVGTIEEAVEALKKEEGPMWHLSFIGVSPEVQGTGLGRALMTTLCGFLDSIDAKCYLECETEWHASYYGHYGFETKVRRSLVTEGCEGQAELFLMLRTPNTVS